MFNLFTGVEADEPVYGQPAGLSNDSPVNIK